MTGTYLEERRETEEVADDELNPVLHSVHPGIVRRQLHLPGVDLNGDDVATPARDEAAARLVLRAGGVREQNCKCIRVPDGELDGVAAAAGEGVDDEVAGRGAGSLRRCDSLRGGGVPALGVHAHAAVVEGEEAVPVGPVLARNGRGSVGGSRLDGLLMRLLRGIRGLRLLRSRYPTGGRGRLGRASAVGRFSCGGAAEDAEEAKRGLAQERDGAGGAATVARGCWRAAPLPHAQSVSSLQC
jgi:hypothetical protein